MTSKRGKLSIRHIQLRRHSPSALEEDLQYSFQYLQIREEVKIYLVNSVTGYNLNNRRGLFYLNKRLLKQFNEKNVYHVDATGRCIPLNEVNDYAIYRFMGTNFYPSAYLAAKWAGEGLLIDMGTSSTDIITLYNSLPCTLALNRPDYNRLATGELSFAGILYTPLEYLTREVPFRSSMTMVCPGVANTGDVYALLGKINANKLRTDYKTGWGFANAHQRLARFLCYDDLLVSKHEAEKLARYVFQVHVTHTIDNVLKVVRAGNLLSDDYTIIGLGEGANLVTKEVAQKLGKPWINLSELLPVKSENVLSALGTAMIGFENETNTALTKQDLQMILNTDEGVESNA